jgi:hypothetical protein
MSPPQAKFSQAIRHTCTRKIHSNHKDALPKLNIQCKKQKETKSLHIEDTAKVRSFPAFLRCITSQDVVQVSPHVMSIVRKATTPIYKGCMSVINVVHNEALGPVFEGLVTRITKTDVRRDAWLLINVSRH